ncbi:TolC family protein [Piscinibacter sp. XHJ-5]|uniref:TolC family protein n=1 Tax=Piscinibacter sp. XHJ-5 TaxID=3037797 RepID=UPI0024536471|nr:TolC family protein [Piscinibacter sp. XHJ-5]
MNTIITLVATAIGVAMLGGCASFSTDGGFDAVADLTQARTGVAPVYQRTSSEPDTAKSRTAELLQQPLTADGAVEVALLNNRGLQARFSELGIAESERVRAGRLRNPTLGFSRLSEGGGVVEIERSIVFDVLGLLTMPWAKEVERGRFERAQLQAAHQAVGLAAQTRRAYFAAVAAQELVRYGQQVKEAADASSELARRMVQAGNFNKLAQMREQAFHADATARLARARHQAVAEREQLARLLGLAGDPPGFELPERLPELPKEPTQPKDAERAAMAQRLDVMMARRSVDSTARALGLGKATRFINVLELGHVNKSLSGEPRADGYEIELQLPLFDFGSTGVARAQATYMQAVHQAAQLAIDARSEVRESYSAYRTAYDLARLYRDDVIPLRKRISEENLLRYNGMLISVFELLADSREQVEGVTGYVEALRDFWVAQTDLQTALTGASPRGGPWLRPMSATSSAGDAAAH